MTSVPDKIRSNIISHTVDVHRYEAGLRKKILQMIDQLGEDLVSQLVGAGLDTPRTAWKQARLQALLRDAGQTIGKAYEGIDATLSEEMKGLVQITSNGITTACNDAFGAALMVPVKWTPELLAKLAGDTLIQGAPSAEWWARQGDGLSQAFADQMRQGMLRGETVTQLRDRIMGQSLPGVNAVGKIDLRKVQPQLRAPIWAARRNAEVLVRTSVISTANAAHMEAFQANADIMDGVQWCSTLDTRTCPSCGALDGREWGWSETHPVPSLHWGCFVAGTKVQAPRILRGFERPYTGNVIIISTAGGNEITCTPNHPILTARGWVAAGDLEEGDEVVKSLERNWVAGPAPDGVEVESRIEDVVCSLLGSRGMVPVLVPLTTEDFHGDALNHQVATVWSDRELWDGMEPTGLEHSEELGLKDRTSGGHAGLPSECSQRLFSECPCPSLHGFMGLLSEAHALVFGRLGHSEDHAPAPIPGSDASFLEPEDYAAPRDPEMCSQGLNARAGVVEPNHLESVDRDSLRCVESSFMQHAVNGCPSDTKGFGNAQRSFTRGKQGDDRFLVGRGSSPQPENGDPIVLQDCGDPSRCNPIEPGDLRDGLTGTVSRANVTFVHNRGLRADGDAVHLEQLGDEMVARAEFARDLVRGCTIPVCLDDVVSVRREFLDGHVYNLETEGNWYVANGIITHNCRCSLLPKTMSWEALAREAHGNSTLAKQLDMMSAGDRASMGGPVSGNLRYEEWFDRQTPERQLEILGPGRLSLYKKGGLGFTDMIGQNGNPLTLEDLRAKVG